MTDGGGGGGGETFFVVFVTSASSVRRLLVPFLRFSLKLPLFQAPAPQFGCRGLGCPNQVFSY